MLEDLLFTVAPLKLIKRTLKTTKYGTEKILCTENFRLPYPIVLHTEE